MLSRQQITLLYVALSRQLAPHLCACHFSKQLQNDQLLLKNNSARSSLPKHIFYPMVQRCQRLQEEEPALYIHKQLQVFSLGLRVQKTYVPTFMPQPFPFVLYNSNTKTSHFLKVESIKISHFLLTWRFCVHYPQVNLFCSPNF